MESKEESFKGYMSEKRFLALIPVCRATLDKYKRKKAFVFFRLGKRCLYNDESLRTFQENCLKRIEPDSTDNSMEMKMATRNKNGKVDRSKGLR
jgi:hypothetical protein